MAAMLAVGTGACVDDRGEGRRSSSAGEADVLLDVDLGGAETDVFLPSAELGPVPVVVMLHGTAGDRTRMHGLAAAVAERGALVYVPSWPVIDWARPYPTDEGDEPFRRQSETVICALRRVRSEAADLGGDPDDVTIVGHSGGAMIGARVALVETPPWPGIDCEPDVAHAPQRFIGIGGDYGGTFQHGRSQAGHYAAHDLFRIEPTNREVEVWLLHGHNDETVRSGVAQRLVEHLAEAHVDSHLLTTDWSHGEPLDPGSPANVYAAEQVASIVAGRADPGWKRLEADAALTFDDAERCDYTGPVSWPRGEMLVIDLANRTDVELSFVFASVRSDVDLDDAALLADDDELRFDRFTWIDHGGFVPVLPGGSTTHRFVFVEADQRYVLFCHPGPDVEHPRPNWMYPAAVLTPTTAPS